MTGTLFTILLIHCPKQRWKRFNERSKLFRPGRCSRRVMLRRCESGRRKSITERTGRRGNTFGTGGLTGDGDVVASAHGANGGAEVTIELRRFRGHELLTERRLGVSEDKRKLLYALRIKGPDGKEDRREIEFDIADDSPPAL